MCWRCCRRCCWWRVAVVGVAVVAVAVVAAVVVVVAAAAVAVAVAADVSVVVVAAVAVARWSCAQFFQGGGGFGLGHLAICDVKEK